MIKVKGFRYYDDYHEFQYTKEFSSTDEFEKWVQNTALKKENIHLPPQDENGNFDSRWAKTYSGNISFTDEDRGGSVSCVTNYIYLIEKDSTIIFSSGTHTNGKAHISSEMKNVLQHLKAYIAADYNFAV